MKSSRYQTSISRKLVSAGVLGCLLAGCTVVGPTAIRSGRLAYNDAITETDNQQLLKTPALRDLNTNAQFFVCGSGQAIDDIDSPVLPLTLGGC